MIVSEWTKLRSLRSTRWSLLVAVVLDDRLPVLFAARSPASRWAHMSPRERPTGTRSTSRSSGVRLSQLAIGVLGVLVITGEYSTGMIRARIAAVPKRLPVLWAKVVVFALGDVRADAVPSRAARLLRQPGDPRSNHHILQTSFSAPGVARSVIGGAVYRDRASAIFALALGAIIAEHGRRDRDRSSGSSS